VSTYKATGIALKSIKLGEADKIITFITAGGKIEAVARGVRRPKSKFGGRLEPGNDLDLVIAGGRTLDIITSVQVLRMRPWIRSDLKTLEIAFSILEMAEKFSARDSADARLLALTTAALDALEHEKRVALLRLAFDIKTLAITGFLPHLTACVICGRTQADFISVAEGGLICGSCRGARQVKPAEKGAIALIRELLNKKFAELDAVQASDDSVAAADDLIWGHINYHVPAKFRARELTRRKGIF
jgi:DNA repair protein RecO (recombination protein O)